MQLQLVCLEFLACLRHNLTFNQVDASEVGCSDEPLSFSVSELTEYPILRPLEIRAARMFQRDTPPTLMDIFGLNILYPNSYLGRGPDGCRYVVGGANPRSNECLLTFSIDMPFVCLVVTELLAWISQISHRFITVTIRRGL